MTPEPNDSAAQEQRLHEVLEVYLKAAEAGQAPDRQELLARHPELANELAAFFADHDRLKRLAEPLRSVIGPALGQGRTGGQATGLDAPGAGPRATPGETGPDPGWTGVYFPPQPLDLASGDSTAPVPPLGTRVRYIGDYELLEELGRGGMGVVYKARQLTLKRLVALKMILAGGHAGADLLARFRSEAVAVARLQHAHIVQIHEVGEHEGHPYFSLEFCPGGGLDRKLQGTPLPPQEAAVLLETLARAVQAAHQAGVVHRDLKPANVLLTAEAQPKITDFGLAKQLDEAGPTLSNVVLGTPSYMAPEQAQGRVKEVGPAADVYALGAILYECLTGRPPFRAATPLDTLAQVVSQEPVAVRQIQPGVPRDLETVCHKCLEKEPGRRYATAAELAQDLGRFLAGEPVAARPVGRWQRGLKWCRRNPAVAGLLAAVFLVLLLGTAVSSYFAVQAARRATEADTNAARADKAKEEADTKARAEAAARLAAQKARVEAEQARAEAEKRRTESEWRLYASQISLAQREWQDNNVAHARAVLDACQGNLRGWEHRYLYTLFNSNQRTFRGHTSRVTSVSFSPDGQHLASGSLDNTVKVWEAATGREVLTLKGHTSWVLSVAYSPDGKRLASGLRDSTVKVWDAATGREALTLKGHTSAVLSVAYSPDGKRLASAAGEVKVWEAATGREALTLKGDVTSVAFSPDGKRLASGLRDGTVKVWEAATGREALTLKGHTNSVTSVAFSPDGKRLAGALWSGEVKVWMAATGRETLTLRGHTDMVQGVSFSPDGQRLASASADHMVKVWDAATGQETLSLKGHSGEVWSVAFSPDGQRLASASYDHTVKVWDPTRGQEALTLQGHTNSVTSVAFSPDGQRLASGSLDNTVKVWEAATGREVLTLKGHTSWVLSVGFSPDGKRLASASQDQTVKVWDWQTGQEVLTLKGHTLPVWSVAFSPDGQYLASTSGSYAQKKQSSGEVKVWEAATGREVLTLKGHTHTIASVAFSPDGQHLAGASYDGTVKVWKTVTGREVLTLKGHTDWVNSVAFSPNGKRLASASGDRTVKVWDVATGRETLTLKGHAGYVASVCFSPDGQRLATASEDHTVKVWEAQTGQETLSLKGGTNSVAFSSDGQRLASGSVARVKVWEATMSQDVLSLKGPTDPVPGVAVCPCDRSSSAAVGGGLVSSRHTLFTADPGERCWARIVGLRVVSLYAEGY